MLAQTPTTCNSVIFTVAKSLLIFTLLIFTAPSVVLLNTTTQVSFLLDEGVASIILQLLQCGLCGTASLQQPPQHQQGASKPHAASGSPFKQPHRRERDTSEEPDEVENSDEAQCAALAQQVHSSVERSLLGQFVRAFLLECNSTAVRWQAHSLLHQLHRHSQPSHREALLTLMWELWPHLPSYGRKAAQFVDLLGYFTLKVSILIISFSLGAVRLPAKVSLCMVLPGLDWNALSLRG